jgi:very-short-patch-repair endonuclease
MIELYGVCSYVETDRFKEQSMATKQNRYNNSTFTNTKQLSESIKKDIARFELINDCTHYQKVISQYGQGWLSIKDRIDFLRYKKYIFVPNNQLPLIQNYKTLYRSSKTEKKIVAAIRKQYSGAIIENTKQIISPYELDIYLPDVKLAIEYNGLFWHSTKNSTSEDYHLMKSLRCREKGIRLIHIYEFEDFKKQLSLLLNLLNGIDNYPDDDFNKNNLIKDIPTPQVIYNENGYIIYGAGCLGRKYIDGGR